MRSSSFQTQIEFRRWRYTIRFTPRKRSSYWSAVNTRRARALIRLGRMKPAGRRAFEARDPGKTAKYSFERRNAPLDQDSGRIKRLIEDSQSGRRLPMLTSPSRRRPARASR